MTAWRTLPKGFKLPKGAGQSLPKTKASQSTSSQSTSSKPQPEPLPEAAPWTRTHTTEELVNLHADHYQRREMGKPIAWAVSSARIRDIERELAERGRLDLLPEASEDTSSNERHCD